MSVVLMRMKKVPENCCECELRQDDFDRGEEFCPFTGVECLSIGRQANCPIIGVLPDTHGRLVDADALDKHVYNDIPISVFGSVKKMASVRQIIEDAPTIVPAAKEGE